MLNYVRAELYKLLHRKYPYTTLLAVLLGEAMLVWGWVFINSRGSDVSFYFGTGILLTFLNVGFFATVLSADMVFSEQYKCCTLKNEVSFGLSRERIYFGKLIVQVIVSVVLCILVVGVYEGLCGIFLIHDEMDSVGLNLLIYCLLGALPLWLGAQAVTNAVFFNVKGEIVSSGIVVLIFTMLHNIIKMLAFFFSDHLLVLYDNMPTVLMEGLSGRVGDWGYLAQCWAVGVVWFVVAAALGMAGFRRKEIS